MLPSSAKFVGCGFPSRVPIWFILGGFPLQAVVQYFLDTRSPSIQTGKELKPGGNTWEGRQYINLLEILSTYLKKHTSEKFVIFLYGGEHGKRDSLGDRSQGWNMYSEALSCGL